MTVINQETNTAINLDKAHYFETEGTTLNFYFLEGEIVTLEFATEQQAKKVFKDIYSAIHQGEKILLV